MSTETVEPVEAQTENTENVPTFTPPDQLSALVLEQINAQAAEYNKGRKILDANSGDVTPLLEELRRNSDDPEIVAMRNEYDALVDKAERIVSKMNERLKGEVEKSRMSDADKAALETTLKELRSEIKAGIEFAKRKYPGIENAVTPLVGSRASSGKGNSATGGRKPRVSTIYVNGEPATETVEKNGESKTISTFTIASKRMGGVKVSDIHEAYFSAAGTTDIENAPDSVEFVLTVGDKSYTVRVDK